jgi:hypothetical protein
MRKHNKSTQIMEKAGFDHVIIQQMSGIWFYVQNLLGNISHIYMVLAAYVSLVTFIMDSLIPGMYVDKQMVSK